MTRDFKVRGIIATMLFLWMPVVSWAQISISGIPEGWRVNGRKPVDGRLSAIKDSSILIIPSDADLKKVKSIKVRNAKAVRKQTAKAEEPAKTVKAEPEITAKTESAPVVTEPVTVVKAEPAPPVKTEPAPVVKAETEVVSAPKPVRNDIRSVDLSAIGSEQIGWIITTEGKVYPTEEDARSMGATPVAKIAYLGNESECTKGLAIALNEASADGMTWKETTAAINNWNLSNAVKGASWRLPSMNDFNHMFGKGKNLSVNMKPYFYWTSQNSGDNLAWYYNVNTNKFNSGNMSYSFLARAVLVF